MGFDLEVAEGRSIAIKPAKNARRTHHDQPGSAAPLQAGRTAKWLTEQTDQKLTGQGRRWAQECRDRRGLLAALEKKIASARHAGHRAQGGDDPPAVRRATPERFALHAPVTHRANRPHHAWRRCWSAWATTRRRSRFLASRSATRRWAPARSSSKPAASLATSWSKAWHVHKQVPKLPPDEDEILHARRHRCAAMPLRRGQEPDGGRPGQALALAGDAGQGPSRSPSSTTRCAPAIRWSGCRRSRSPHSIGK